MAKTQSTFFSILGEIRSENGLGYYGTISIRNHEGINFVAYKGNMNEREYKLLAGKRMFIRLEYRNNKFIFNKAIPCAHEVFKTIMAEHRKQLAAIRLEREKSKSTDVT